MKNLIFVTLKFPYGKDETFIENEIDCLSNAFDKVFIYAIDAHDTDSMRQVPENVFVFASNPQMVSKKDYLTSLFNVSVIKEIFKNCLKGKFIRKISACCYFYSSVLKVSGRIREFLNLCDIKSDDVVTVYSYWLSTVGMCAIKIHDTLQKSKIKARLVSRCHRFDIYKEFSYTNYLPFQEYMLSRFNGVFPCSKDGENYLRKLYPRFASKIDVAYLGVKDNFNGNLPKREGSFNIVSCSNVVPVKRVNLIIESLAEITKKNITWTHFGDGEDFEKIKALAKEKLPENIKYEFKGRIPNGEIYDFYNNNNVNLFINVSKSEGLPVSIMEAVSFGIPVIATDVGGTGEIVKDGKNGFLINSDFEALTLSNSILAIADFTDEKYILYCKNSRKLFEENFDAKTKFYQFCKTIHKRGY